MKTGGVVFALDQMTQTVVGRKGISLTPVGTEPGGPLGGAQPGAPFPYDTAGTMRRAIADAQRAITDIRAHIDHVSEGLEVLSSLYANSGGEVVEVPVASAPAPRPSPVAPETERFAEDFGARQKQAQAAAFAPAAPTQPEPTTAGWQCPEHGYTDIVVLTSRKGREYNACRVSGCVEFQKGT